MREVEDKNTKQLDYEEFCADFKEIEENLKSARKYNSQSKVLSAIALFLSVNALIIRIVMAQ